MHTLRAWARLVVVASTNTAKDVALAIIVAVVLDFLSAGHELSQKN